MSTFRKFWERKPRTDYFEFFNDFTKPTDYDTADWTLTTTEAGAGAATEAIGNLAGGVLVVTNDAADDDADFFQSTKEVYKYAANKALEFEIRFKLSDVTQSDFIAGLVITDTTPLANSDGIFFRKNDADTYPDLVICKNGTETVIALPDPLVDDTWVKLGFYHDEGGDTIQAFVNDVRVGAITDLTNAPDDEELAVTFGIQNGEAVAKVLSVDYIRVIEQR
jgi:hypothetical protein